MTRRKVYRTIYNDMYGRPSVAAPLFEKDISEKALAASNLDEALFEEK